MTSVLITGANGFIGESLLYYLAGKNYHIVATYHEYPPIETSIENITWVRFDLSGCENDYDALLDNIDYVVHLAGYAHVTSNDAKSVEFCKKVNIDGTLTLLNEACKREVKLFVYISTIKVLGEQTYKNSDEFVEDNRPDPHDIYAESKLQTENNIKKICENHEMKYVILRPPLVYGPNVKANFLRLIDLISMKIPLPFASIKSKRALLYVDNLSHAIYLSLKNRNALNKIYHVSDQNISLIQLIEEIAKNFGFQPRLFPIPNVLLNVICGLIGKKEEINRLTGSLTVCSEKIRQELNWQPVSSFEDGINKTIEWYRNRNIR